MYQEHKYDFPSEDEIYDMLREAEIEEQLEKDFWKEKLKDNFPNSQLVFKFLDEDHYWKGISIVEVYDTDEKTSGYRSYQHVRIKDDTDNYLYLKQKEDIEEIGVNHYCVWQTCGYSGDDYSGYLLLPLNNGKYFKIEYSC